VINSTFVSKEEVTKKKKKEERRWIKICPTK